VRNARGLVISTLYSVFLYLRIARARSGNQTPAWPRASRRNVLSIHEEGAERETDVPRSLPGEIRSILCEERNHSRGRNKERIIAGDNAEDVGRARASRQVRGRSPSNRILLVGGDPSPGQLSLKMMDPRACSFSLGRGLAYPSFGLHSLPAFAFHISLRGLPLQQSRRSRVINDGQLDEEKEKRGGG